MDFHHLVIAHAGRTREIFLLKTGNLFALFEELGLTKYRRFIAKGERISDYGIDAIARIEDWCNNLPRKILGYKPPDELFEAKLDEIYSD